MQVEDINQIYWVQSEPGTDVSEAISLAYERMGLSENKELTVNADGATTNELYAFELVARTKIAKGIKRMLSEYAEFEGRRIESFTMMEHDGGPALDLWINLGENDQTPGPPGQRVAAPRSNSSFGSGCTPSALGSSEQVVDYLGTCPIRTRRSSFRDHLPGDPVTREVRNTLDLTTGGVSNLWTADSWATLAVNRRISISFRTG